MAHKNWCGLPCADCENICYLDQHIPCSPDCEHLSPEGKMAGIECLHCDTNYYAKILHEAAKKAEEEANKLRKKAEELEFEMLYPPEHRLFESKEAAAHAI